GHNLRELAHLVSLGMSPMDAIVAGTRTASELLGLQASVGTLEPGKRADLVLCDTGDDRVHRAHPERDEVGQLAQVVPVRHHRRVRAHGDLHAARDGAGDVLLRDAGPADLLLVVVRLHGGLVDAVEDRGERRHDEDPALARQLARLLGEAVAV
ncbi:amidohydrolase family protein, partial [Streptomyces daliensis]|nr:amidohydrolase family protein [Streptomyces daliensis]